MPTIINELHNYQLAVNVCSRAVDTLSNHPRLRLDLLQYQKEALDEMEHDDADEFELATEILRLGENIIHADRGELDQIIPSGHLKHDPVEWTAQFEEVIDQAEEKAYKELENLPRGMGFCHAYWPTLAGILRSDYGISWRSPALMNPRVMFD